MTPEQIDLLLELQHRQMTALEKIALALEKLAPTKAPDYHYPLESFNSFDWASIGAEIIRKDEFGAAIVTWSGKQYVRRSPNNKYGAAIWFSRCVGKKEDGTNEYEKLITFKSSNAIEVEPISGKAVEVAGLARARV